MRYSTLGHESHGCRDACCANERSLAGVPEDDEIDHCACTPSTTRRSQPRRSHVYAVRTRRRHSGGLERQTGQDDNDPRAGSRPRRRGPPAVLSALFGTPLAPEQRGRSRHLARPRQRRAALAPRPPTKVARHLVTGKSVTRRRGRSDVHADRRTCEQQRARPVSARLRGTRAER